MFGPSCDEALTTVAFNPAVMNQNGRRKFPLLTAGGLGLIFSGQKTHPDNTYYMLTRTGVSYRDVAKTFIRFMRENNWKKFLLAYKGQDRVEWTGDRSCEFFKSALKIQTSGTDFTNHTIQLDRYEETRGFRTHEQHIESYMKMLKEVLPSKNSRYNIFTFL